MTTRLAKFDPKWNSPFDLGSFTEGTIVLLHINTENQTNMMIPANTGALECTTFAAGITSVVINGREQPFYMAGTTVLFPTTTLESSTIKITSRLSNKIAVLCGTLPPGLYVSNEGVISGRLGAIIPLGTTIFEFVLRATNVSGNVSDMTFSFTGTSESYPETFNLSSLPSPVTDPYLNISYIPLGSYQPSQSVAYSIDIIAYDGAPALLNIDSSFFILENNNSEFTGPPTGVMLVGTEIVGQVDPAAEIGLYLFRTSLVGTSLNLIFGIEVVSYAGTGYAPTEALKWVTDSNLGSIGEGVPCYLSVKALSYNSPVSYSLVEVSSNFPPGLSLNAAGELLGALSYGLAQAVFAFTIRATAGTTFIDRVFTLAAISKYNSATIYDISFVLEQQQANAFSSPYNALIAGSSLFRADDSNFGMASPFIYLFNGIDGSIDLTTVLSPEGRPAVTNSSYFSPMRMIIGEHVATTVYDSFGIAAYDVIYRKLYEFDSGAGGFTAGDSPVAFPVLYPQSRVSGGIYVYPVCTRNMRCKLLISFGCATNTNANAKTMGVAAGETPPLWMQGEYILALPIAYVLPEQGQGIAAMLNVSSIVPPNGTEYTFDRLYCRGGVTEYLQF